jgi:hypothetical protein
MYNCKDKDLDDVPYSDWETPDFVKIKNKKTKRISPYLEYLKSLSNVLIHSTLNQ